MSLSSQYKTIKNEIKTNDLSEKIMKIVLTTLKIPDSFMNNSNMDQVVNYFQTVIPNPKTNKKIKERKDMIDEICTNLANNMNKTLHTNIKQSGAPIMCQDISMFMINLYDSIIGTLNNNETELIDTYSNLEVLKNNTYNTYNELKKTIDVNKYPYLQDTYKQLGDELNRNMSIYSKYKKQSIDDSVRDHMEFKKLVLKLNDKNKVSVEDTSIILTHIIYEFYTIVKMIRHLHAVNNFNKVRTNNFNNTYEKLQEIPNKYTHVLYNTVNLLKSTFTNADLINFIQKKGGNRIVSDDDGLPYGVTTMDNFGMMGPENVFSNRKNAPKNSVENILYNKKMEKSKLFKEFNHHIKSAYHIIGLELQKIKNRLGKDIKINDHLHTFIRNLSAFGEISPTKQNLHKALSGYTLDSLSENLRDKYLSSLGMLLDTTVECARQSTGFNDLAKSIKNLIQLIGGFREYMTNRLSKVSSVTGGGSSDYDNAIIYGGLANCMDYGQGIIAINNAELGKVGGSSSSSMGGELAAIIEGGATSDFKYLIDIKKSIRELEYYYRIANVKMGMSIAATQTKNASKNYSEISAEECAMLIDKINQKFNWLTCTTEYRKSNKRSINEVYPESSCVMYHKFQSVYGPSEMGEYWEGFVFLMEYMRATKVAMLEAACKLDIYLGKFTETIQNNPDNVKNFLHLLNNLEIIAKWFTDKSGDNLVQVFEATANGSEEHIKLKDISGHYYATLDDSKLPKEYMKDGIPLKKTYVREYILLVEKAFKSMKALDNIIKTFSRIHDDHKEMVPIGMLIQAFTQYAVSSSLGLMFESGGEELVDVTDVKSLKLCIRAIGDKIIESTTNLDDRINATGVFAVTGGLNIMVDPFSIGQSTESRLEDSTKATKTTPIDMTMVGYNDDDKARGIITNEGIIKIKLDTFNRDNSVRSIRDFSDLIIANIAGGTGVITAAAAKANIEKCFNDDLTMATNTILTEINSKVLTTAKKDAINRLNVPENDKNGAGVATKLTQYLSIKNINDAYKLDVYADFLQHINTDILSNDANVNTILHNVIKLMIDNIRDLFNGINEIKNNTATGLLPIKNHTEDDIQKIHNNFLAISYIVEKYLKLRSINDLTFKRNIKLDWYVPNNKIIETVKSILGSTLLSAIDKTKFESLLPSPNAAGLDAFFNDATKKPNTMLRELIRDNVSSTGGLDTKPDLDADDLADFIVEFNAFDTLPPLAAKLLVVPYIDKEKFINYIINIRKLIKNIIRMYISLRATTGTAAVGPYNIYTSLALAGDADHTYLNNFMSDMFINTQTTELLEKEMIRNKEYADANTVATASTSAVAVAAAATETIQIINENYQAMFDTLKTIITTNANSIFTGGSIVLDSNIKFNTLTLSNIITTNLLDKFVKYFVYDVISLQKAFELQKDFSDVSKTIKTIIDDSFGKTIKDFMKEISNKLAIYCYLRDGINSDKANTTNLAQYIAEMGLDKIKDTNGANFISGTNFLVTNNIASTEFTTELTKLTDNILVTEIIQLIKNPNTDNELTSIIASNMTYEKIQKKLHDSITNESELFVTTRNTTNDDNYIAEFNKLAILFKPLYAYLNNKDGLHKLLGSATPHDPNTISFTNTTMYNSYKEIAKYNTFAENIIQKFIEKVISNLLINADTNNKLDTQLTRTIIEFLKQNMSDLYNHLISTSSPPKAIYVLTEKVTPYDPILSDDDMLKINRYIIDYVDSYNITDYNKLISYNLETIIKKYIKLKQIIRTQYKELPISGGSKSGGGTYVDSYVQPEEIYVMAVKSMVSKIFVVIGAYSLFNKPPHSFDRNDGIASRPLRQILGGGSNITIIEEATETYIRLILLAEWYRDLFKFDRNAYDLQAGPEDKTISMIPSLDGIWAPFVKAIFVDGMDIKDGQYTEYNSRDIIESINNIYKSFKGKYGSNCCLVILENFISEINMRYGVLKRSQIDKYLTGMYERLNNNDSYEDELDDNLDTLDYDTTEYSNPTSKYQTVKLDNSRKSRLKNRRFLKEMMDFRLRVETKLALVSGNDDALFGKNTLINSNLDDIIRNTRKLIRESKPSDHFKVIHSVILGGDRYSHIDHDVLLQFHEQVINPLTILYSVYKILNEWNGFIHVLDCGNLDNEGSTKFIEACRKNISAKSNVNNYYNDPRLYFTHKYLIYCTQTTYPSTGTFITSDVYTDGSDPKCLLLQLINQIMYLCCDKNPLVEVRFSKEYPMLTFDAIEHHVLTLVRNIEDSLRTFDKTIPHITKRYREGDTNGKLTISPDGEYFAKTDKVNSLYYIKEHLVDRLLGSKYGLNLRSGNIALQNLWKYLIKYTKEKEQLIHKFVYKTKTLVKVPTVTNDYSNLRLTTDYISFPMNKIGIVDNNKTTGDITSMMSKIIMQGTGTILPHPFISAMRNNTSETYANDKQLFSKMEGNATAILNGNYNNVISTAGNAYVKGASNVDHVYFGYKGIYDDVFPENSMDDTGGLVIKFNRLLFNYIELFTDKSSNKIYMPLLEKLSQNMADEIMNSTKNGLDDVTIGVTGGDNPFINSTSYNKNFNDYIFCRTMAAAIAAIMTNKRSLGSTNIYTFVEQDLVNVPNYMKDIMTATLPIFNKHLNIIINQAKFIKNTILHISEVVVVSGATTATKNTDKYSATLEKLIRGCTTLQACCSKVYIELNDIPLYFELYDNSIAEYKNKNGYLPFMPLSHMSHLLNNHVRLADNQTLTYAANTFDAVMGGGVTDPGSKYDVPVKKTFNITAIGNITQMAEITAGTVGTELSTHHCTYEKFGLIPRNDLTIGEPSFSFMYGTRGLLSDDIEPNIKLAPGITSAVDIYNSKPFGVNGGSLDTKLVNQTFTSSVHLLRYCIDYIYHKTYLIDNDMDKTTKHYIIRGNYNTAAAGAPAAAVPGNCNILHNLSCQTGRSTIQLKELTTDIKKTNDDIFIDSSNILLLVSNDNYKESVKKMLKCIEKTDGISDYKQRTNLQIYNILDTNIVPINFHAMQRELPFANLFNYSYTFDHFMRDRFGVMYNIHNRNRTYGQDTQEGPYAYTQSNYPYNKKGLYEDDIITDMFNDRIPYTTSTAATSGRTATTTTTMTSATTFIGGIRTKKYNFAEDQFVNILCNPYERNVQFDDFINPINKIMNGADGISTGRPKYLSDQLWNKVLLNSTYTTEKNSKSVYKKFNVPDSLPDQLSYPPNLKNNGKNRNITFLPLSVKTYQQITVIGYNRYNTYIVRSIEWFVHLQRVMRLLMNEYLEWIDGSVVNKSAVAATGITEYKNDNMFDPNDF